MSSYQNYLEAKHQLVYFSTSECILTTEIETIMSAVGGEDFGAIYKTTMSDAP